MDWLTHVRIEVHWVNEIYIRILLSKVFYSCTHMDETITKVLTTMTGNKDELLTIWETTYIITCYCKYIVLFLCKYFVVLQFANHHVEGINNSITSYEDLTKDFLCKKVYLWNWGWWEVIGSNTTGDLAIHFLWPRTIDVVGTKASLYVANRNLCIECCKGSCCRSGSITMDKHYIRTTLLEHVTHTSKDASGHIS